VTTPRRPAAEILAGAVVVVVYAVTMARTVTKWDSGELLAAVHALGIPHPPGTPLYVLVARAFSVLPLPVPWATRVNLLSAISAAVAVTLLGTLIRRWTGDRIAGVAAVLCAAAASTLWLTATEVEVYALALLLGVGLLWIADRAPSRDCRSFALLIFLAVLGWSVHPLALVTLPGAALLLVERGWGLRQTRNDERVGHDISRFRCVGLIIVAAVLGASAVLFLIIRAQHDPAINQGNPATTAALWDVLSRAQYAPAGFWPRQAPLWLQIGNWFEYADWQFALGLDPGPPPSWRRTPISIVFAALGAVGLVAHARMDRRSWRALAVAFLCASLGIIVYANLKAGPSYGVGFLPPGAAHEARERDYFFTASFMIWGAWAGLGAVALGRTVAHRIVGPRAQMAHRAAVTVSVGLAAIPLLLNYSVVRTTRALGSEVFRAQSLSKLAPLPNRAVFMAIGDNDTYPLWYLQQVEHARVDVTVVTIPLLGATWYREELARRYGLLEEPASTWRGIDASVREICLRAASLGRPIVLSPHVTDPRFREACPEFILSSQQHR
jgi:hypothetical protein